MIVITDLIREQAVQSIVMAGAGIFTMIMYQSYRHICSMLRISAIIAAVSEIIFWAASAVAVSQFLYYCAYGRLSFHSAAAFVMGALLWKKLFYAIIDKIYARICIKQGICKKYGEKEKKQPIQRH